MTHLTRGIHLRIAIERSQTYTDFQDREGPIYIRARVALSEEAKCVRGGLNFCLRQKYFQQKVHIKGLDFSEMGHR